jgi:3',5'-cyclic AMP phosphodiesterase CpdA
MAFKIAHLSDLHFSHISYSVAQFCSKRWLGNLNYLLKRKRYFDYFQLEQFPKIIRENKIDLIVITGDLTITGELKEFDKARDFIRKCEKSGAQVLVIPGNHDHYTQRGWKKKIFYDVFPNEGLRKEGITKIALNKHWTLVALDTAIATTLTSSRGRFSKEMEKNLEVILSSIPSTHHIILANHFPLFAHEHISRTLERASDLRALLKRFPRLSLYIHGHTHGYCVADLRSNQLPIIADCGSTTSAKRGSWNLIHLSTDALMIQAFEHIHQPFFSRSWNLQDALHPLLDHHKIAIDPTAEFFSSR